MLQRNRLLGEKDRGYSVLISTKCEFQATRRHILCFPILINMRFGGGNEAILYSFPWILFYILGVFLYLKLSYKIEIKGANSFSSS